MFGGSTLWGTAARDDYTIPSLVAKYLSERGLNVRVTNYGETGYVNTQEVVELLTLLQKGNIPDIVVFYDGVNDTFSAYQNRVAGLPQNESNRVKEFNLLLRPHAVAKLFLKNTVEDSNIYKVAGMISNKLFGHRSPLVRQENMPDNKDYLLAKGVENIYLANMKLVENLSNHRFISLFFWQPTIFNKNHLTSYEHQEAEKAKCRQFVKMTYDVMEHKQAQLVKYNFFNISDIFMHDPDGLFVDWCHIREKGNKIIAARIGHDILKVWWEKNPLQKSNVSLLKH